MIRNRLVFMYASLAVIFVAIILINTFPPRSYAQDDPTQIRQTIDAIISPRLTLTARSAFAQTSTSAAEMISTNYANLTGTAADLTSTAIIGDTATIDALTATYTPSLTPTPSLSPSPSPTVIYFTPTPISASDQQSTLIAEVSRLLTSTAQFQSDATQTAIFEGTVNALLIQTLGVTATPGGNLTSHVLPGTDVALTDTAKISLLLTQTAESQMTAAFQSTFDSIIQRTQGVTATPSATPTPNLAQLQLTQDALVSRSLTETPEARLQLAQTAQYQATITELTNRFLTATSVSLRATLRAGFENITPQTVGKLQKFLVSTGHTASVQSVAFSPDGAEFATAGLDNTVRLWNTLTGDLLLTIKGLTNRLCIAFSPDGTEIAAGSGDSTIRIYNARTGEEIAVFRGHTKQVVNLAFSPDSSLLASASADGTAGVWDVKSGTEIQSLKAHRGAVLSVAFSPDGARLATGGQDNNIYIWEAKTGVQLSNLRDSQQVATLAFGRDGTMLASAGNGHLVQFWNSETGAKLSTLRGGNANITSIAFSADSSCIAAGTQDGTIWIWDTVKATQLVILRGHLDSVNSIAFGPEGTRLITAGNDQKVVIWTIQRPK